MGAEESKGANYGLMRPSAVVANMNRQAQAARAWSLLHMCSLEQWKSGHAGKWHNLSFDMGDYMMAQ